MQNICSLTLARIIPVGFVRAHGSAKEFFSFLWIGVPDVVQLLELMHFLFLCRHLVKLVVVRHHRIIYLFLVSFHQRSIIGLVAPEEVSHLLLVYVLVRSFLYQLSGYDLPFDATSHSLTVLAHSFLICLI